MTQDEVHDDDPNFEDEDLDLGDEEFILADWDLSEEDDFLLDESPVAGGTDGASEDSSESDDDELAGTPEVGGWDSGTDESAAAASESWGYDADAPVHFGERPDKSESEADEPVAAKSDSEVAASHQVESAESDVLFEYEPLQSEEIIAPATTRFSEDSGAEWAGADIALEDLGMEMVDRPREQSGLEDDDDEVFDISADDELTLVDVEGELDTEWVEAGELDTESVEAGELDTESVEAGELDDELVEAGASDTTDIDTKVRDFEIKEDTEEEWRPVDESDEDDEEDYDDAEEISYEYEGEEGEEGEEGDPDYSEYEEAYYDETDGYHRREGRRASPMLWISGLAAALLVSAFTGIYLWKPELFLTDAEDQVIEVIQVDRPAPVVDIKPPNVPAQLDPTTGDPTTGDPTTGDPTTGDPTTGDPTTGDPTTGDPTTGDPTTGDPTTGDPTTGDSTSEDPTSGDPTTGDPTTGDPTTGDPTTGDPTDFVQIGEAGDSVSGTGDASVMDELREQTVQSYNGLVMGTQALAQLYNDNIFVGRVKALNASSVTLRMEVGEITLARDDLRSLTPLAASEYIEWKDVVSTGYIRLSNRNRLKGKIVETRDDSVILMVNANRVIIPKATIEEMGKTGNQKGIQMSTDESVENDDWFRNLVERKISERDANAPLTETKSGTGSGTKMLREPRTKDESKAGKIKVVAEPPK